MTRDKKILGILPDIFRALIAGHEPEEILKFNNFWTRSIGPWEVDHKIYLGLVVLGDDIILEVWRAEDKRMRTDEIDCALLSINAVLRNKISYGTMSIIANLAGPQKEEVKLNFQIHSFPGCPKGMIELNHPWFPLWVFLQRGIYEKYEKIMSETEEV